nr:winged helix-turn-helix domain-containing protein [Marivita sp. S6314]
MQLRNKSKAVLSFLAQRPNRTVAKSDILEEIWTDVIASDESLVQCIADIRRTLGADARRIVETVPREGYRLNVETAEDTSLRMPVAGWIAALSASLALAWWVWPVGPDGAPPVAPAGQIASASTPPGTQSEAAYLEVLQGRLSANHFSLDDSLTAERHFRSAIALDPEYARAHAELGTLLAVRFENDWTVLYEADKQKALYYAQRAVNLEPDLWLGHYALGRLHSVFRNPDMAEAHLRTALSLKPENEDARAYLGVVLNLQGDAEAATTILRQAIATHPNPPFWYYFGLGHALFNTGQYASAKAALNTCLSLSEGSPYCLRYLIAVNGEIGTPAEAAAAMRTYEALGFKLTVDDIASTLAHYRPKDRARLETALRLAGVPG